MIEMEIKKKPDIVFFHYNKITPHLQTKLDGFLKKKKKV